MFAEDDEGEVMDEEEMYIEAQQKLEQEKESIMANLNQNMIPEVRKYSFRWGNCRFGEVIVGLGEVPMFCLGEIIVGLYEVPMFW